MRNGWMEKAALSELKLDIPLSWHHRLTRGCDNKQQFVPQISSDYSKNEWLAGEN